MFDCSVPILSTYRRPGAIAKRAAITTRYFVASDIVSRLPPPLVFALVGTAIYINDSGNRIVSPLPPGCTCRPDRIDTAARSSPAYLHRRHSSGGVAPARARGNGNADLERDRRL